VPPVGINRRDDACAANVNAQANPPIVIREAAIVDSIAGPDALKPSGSNKLLWVKIEVIPYSRLMTGIPLAGIKAVASDKSEWKLVGYRLGDSKGPEVEKHALSPEQQGYTSVDSNDGKTSWVIDGTKETFSINTDHAILSLTFEIPSGAAMVEVRGFGPRPIPIPPIK
jgi:hypothetical protein